jgi:hypothetical protein
LIRFSKYININSVVGGAATAAGRLWCGRIFTTNSLVGPNSILQFADAGDVGTFFGTTSEEYARAVNYFAYQSPLGTAPTALQFARFVNAAQPATIYGESNLAVLATLTGISAGLLSFKFGSTTVNLTGISLTGSANMTAVATALQTAIRAGSGAPNGELTSATVTWNAAAQAFDFSASPTGVVTESFQVVTPTGAVPATDVAAALGWYASQGALVNSASAIETAVAGFTRVQTLNNNFGSFCYTAASALALSDATAIAAYNAGLNVKYIYRVAVTPTTWATWQAALIGYAGTGLEYDDVSTTGSEQYPESSLPMAIQASTNYNAINGAVGYMYKQNGNVNASVTTDTLSDQLDAARVNYVGATMQAGQTISFYQRGVLCGPSTSPQDSTVFANEQWFKDHQATNLMNLQLSVGQIPANAAGQAMCEQVIQGQTQTATTQASGIELALLNGTISANSSLTVAQQIYITQQSGDSTAWQQVQVTGYWFATNITSAVAASGVTEYTLNYTIIYRKDDVIKTIVGSHQLI